MSINQAQSESSGELVFPDQGVIHDLAGLPVDASGWEWRLNIATASNLMRWKRLPFHCQSNLDATVRFIRHVMESQSSTSAMNTFRALVLAFQSPSFVEADLADEVIPINLFHDLRGAAHDWRLHYVRQWYSFGADHGFKNFSPEVAFAIDQIRIGGNEKGQAVLSMDPETGPLTDLEVNGLLNALRAADNSSLFPLQWKAALWLSIALGPNPMQMALLREEDLKVFEDDDGNTYFQIDVPRHKKGDVGVRDSFRRRALNAEIGQILLELIDRNGAERLEWPDDAPVGIRPLFHRQRPRRSIKNGPMAEYAMHLTSTEFSDLVRDAADALSVMSHRTNAPLKVNSRRLRYTFATRLVREGVSKREVAELLDHSDLQNVQVYFDLKSDIVEKLDKAMALALGPIAQAFMGKVVRGPEEATRGADPASKVAVFDAENSAIKEVGSCGSFSFCRLAAPVACYTCKSFQPWMDGPHDILLDDLLKQRERKQAAGLDGRMVALMDSTIIAIADVISRIDAIRAGEAA